MTMDVSSGMAYGRSSRPSMASVFSILSASGLVKDGDTWVNRESVKGGPVIEIYINQGVGSVTLEVE